MIICRDLLRSSYILFTITVIINAVLVHSELAQSDEKKGKEYMNDADPAIVSKGGQFNNVKSTKSKVKRVYPGGCIVKPDPPLNGHLRCSVDSGCIANCNSDYKFPNGVTQLAVTCKNGTWHVQGTEWISIPHCEPICMPECQNGGICTAPNRCDCSERFTGAHCQFENKPCLNKPVAILNGHKNCNSEFCTFTCIKNFAFPDGSSVANLICKNGNWQPARADWVSIPDCQPVCDPPCQNGGNCLPKNTCQCPQEYRGPQCQYSTNVCSPERLNFNGGFSCTSNSDNFECQLHCPSGSSFESPPADVYTCAYDKGIFQPQPIPRCKYEEHVNIVSVDTSYNSYTQTTNHSWLVEDTFEKSASYNETRTRHEYRRSDVKSGGTGVSTVKEIRKQPKTCFVWGKTHYKTFDGKIFNLESDCSHVLLQDARDGILTIASRDSASCQNSTQSCFRSTKFFLRGKEYILSNDENGLPTFSNTKRSLAIPMRLPGLHVDMSAHFIVVTLDVVGVKVKWDGKLMLQIEASEAMWKNTMGLCGTMNGNPEDDMIGRNGNHLRSIVSLASSWKLEDIGETCNEYTITEHSCKSNSYLLSEAYEFCTRLLSDSRFKPCYGTIDFAELEDTCVWEYCACTHTDKKECACETMNVYVRQCAHQGIVSLAGWRNNETCPIYCDNARVYMSCGPKERASCGMSVETTSKDDKDCEEGCFCPEGTLMHDGKCISAEECPCKLRGRTFQPGTSVPKDCNTCTCVSGKWICTQTRCAARCAAIGDPHYVTFDGRHYDFMGKCKYYLMKGDDYSIAGENVACSGAISESMGLIAQDAPSCTNAVTIKLKNVSVKLRQNRGITVNAEEVTKLPVLIGDIKIRAASSIFIVVELANGLEVWWDGISRVYVNAPATFHGMTKGLCGTFNENQNDDFLTPDGDVERTAIPFANKWKTDDQCVDMPESELKHPCDVNPQKRPAAERHCSKIFSDIFSECHWHVDPESFYKDCLFDMCSCESNIESCLCPMLSAYAKECAALGVKLLWRERVDECKIHCNGGQIYQICGNSCTRSCSDISFNTNCRQECVEGCNCPEGETLDANGECIPIGQCPCTYMGLEFKPGYQETRPGRKSRELCTCTGGTWNCRPATSEEIKEYPGSSELSTVCVASKHLEITDCMPSEPRTCRNMHAALTAPTVKPCRSGCVCRAGYVLDVPGGVCIEETTCPCHHGGKSYKQGEVVQDNCNTCKCMNSKWNCTDRICAGVCSAWGDSHFKTFDGKLYNFEGACDYVLAKSVAKKQESFDVSIQNVPCGTTGATCSKSVTLTVGSDENRESITLTRDKELPKENFKRMAIRMAGLFVFVDVPDLGIVLQWDKGTRIYVRLDPKWKGRTRGLCGDYNDNAEDDFQTPYGGISEASVNLFGDSWKRNDYCRAPENMRDPCEIHPERKLWAVHKCGILKSDIFRPCHSEVEVEQYMENCIFDSCGCDSGGDCECLCTALAAYAHECNARGVPIKWRSQDLCPLQCNENCSSYSPCISACPRETCESVTTLKDQLHLCAEDTCIEGCSFKPCPENYVYSNSSYKECVPKASCKVFCMEINQTTYYEGDEVSSDGCQTCYCTRGKVICSGEPCRTTTEARVTDQAEESQKCVDGWTAWINHDKVTKGKKVSDIEPLPEIGEIAVLNGSGICNRESMINIRCRSVKHHLQPKETGLDVECSLERGLYCQPQPGLPCIDFEISVLCQCSKTTPETITEGIYECDPLYPNEPHPTNCHLFYQCVPGITKNERVEKSCGPDMLYNPQTYICDWPANVMALRPECASSSSSTTQPTSTSPCKDGEMWSDCAIKCDRTCEHYHHTLLQQGHCSTRSNCIAGCVPDESKCENKFWRDEKTCVAASDCICKSRDGNPVKPGAVVKESECEICQCIDNYYTCDNSLCNVTKTQPPTEFTTTEQIRYDTSTLSPTTKQTVVIPSTVTPPLPCISENYIPLIRYLSPKNVSIDASSIAKTFENSPGSWEPAFNDADQWLDVKFQNPEAVYGVILRGSPVEEKFVTSYKILYSENGRTFTYVLDNTNEPQVFRGPTDAEKPVEQRFHVPVEAKIIRLIPLSWHNGISVRMEVVGCTERVIPKETSTTEIPETTTPVYFEKLVEPVCSDSMGLDEGLISVEELSASSSIFPSLLNLRLSSPHPWRPKLDNPYQYIQFDFLEPRNLTGVATKGGDDAWSIIYSVSHSINGHDWNPVVDDNGVERKFLANFDSHTVKKNFFDKPVRARFLKIHPQKWHNHIALRAEIIGCFSPYPTSTVFYEESTTFKTVTTTVESKCEICDGILIESGSCNCEKPYAWNGTSCVLEHECPCVIGHIRYAVGSVFESEKCERCICTLGGVPTCSPKKCEPCTEPGMRSIVTELCTCMCKPCPSNTKHCPTSDVCIDEKLWCNGIQDCADDEINCGTVITVPSTSQHFEIYNVTTTTITNHTTVRVVTTACKDPTCPPGYKTILMDGYTQQTNSVTESHTNVKHSVKGSSKKKYSRKKAFNHDTTNNTNAVDKNSLECPRFTCVPIIVPPTKDQDKPEVCPDVWCPPDYLIVYEKMSMYKLSRCPKYTCKPPPPQEAICNVTGRTFNTFDNTEYKYDVCNHILAREMFSNKWYITLEKQCKTKNSCRQNLVIVIDDDILVLHTDMHIEINDHSFTPVQIKRLGEKYGFKVSCVGDSIYFASRRYGFWIVWESNANVKIGISTKLANRVDGLCGYFDGYAANDKQMPDGSQARTTTEFGDSWKMENTDECDTQECDHNEDAWEICQTIKDHSFAPCSGVMNIQNFLSRCVESTCDCLRSNQTYMDCRCRTLTSFVAECEAADRDADLSQWRIIQDCPMSCPAPFVYKDCFRSNCESTCTNLREIEPCPVVKGMCFPGCYCPDGMVRNDDECVPATECRDCVCEGFGNSKFISFDKKSYEFSGNCTYVLSREIVPNGDRAFEILLSNVNCETGVCTYAITILNVYHTIEITKEGSLSKPFTIMVDGTEIHELPKDKQSVVKFEETNDMDIILRLPLTQLEITCFHRNFAFTLKVPSHILGDAMEGLCGNCNGDIEDDFKKRDGEMTDDANTFGNSWAVADLPDGRHLNLENCAIERPKNCTVPPFEKDPCEILLDQVKFGNCHSLVDPKPYFDVCRDSVCVKGEYCDSLEAYARQCAKAGLCLDWRTPGMCAYECPSHLEYQACGSSCRESCDNLLELNSTKCHTSFTEGCFCPKDHVLHNDTCIPKEKCFVCDAEGHVEGDKWSPDKCTTCTCEGLMINCRETECPIMDTACQQDMKLVAVSSTEAECCPKYVCVPMPTQAPICPEIQQPDCSFGQEMKLSTDSDGCPQFVCQCLPPEKCPTFDEVALEVEDLEPGFVRIMNTSGCCPRPVSICKLENCAPKPQCPLYYKTIENKPSDACCPIYKCEPPKDICLYDSISAVKTNEVENIEPKKIGEKWAHDKCTMCSCEEFDGAAKISCVSLTCPKIEDHPDINDYVIEEILLKDECCPKYERTACKHEGEEYDIGVSWQPIPEDPCTTMQCIKDQGEVRKQTRIQECNITCNYGEKYEAPIDSNVTCCGKCIAFACIVGDTLKNIGESWYSDDHCTLFSCRHINENDHQPSISMLTETCPDIDLAELQEFEIEKQVVPGKCCPEIVKTACRHEGNIYRPGDKWKASNDSCMTETCVLENNKIKKNTEVDVCNKECRLGWIYKEPNETKCCGECEEAFCVVGDILYQPGETWSSNDGCIVYSCTNQSQQLSIIRSSAACPDVTDCPAELIYEDGCCKQCNLTTLNQLKSCTVKMLNTNSTIGIFTERHRVHGICQNVLPVEGITECRGTCESSTYFDEYWNRVNECLCCQPTEFRTLVTPLICGDGKTVEKKLFVPSSCSCTACGSIGMQVKGRKTNRRG